MSRGKKRRTLKFSPSNSLYLLVFSPVVIYFGEESAVLCSVEYKGSLAMGFLGIDKVSACTKQLLDIRKCHYLPTLSV